MPPKDLAALNDQLAHGGDITADTARRMGLFVVGSLAKRHGIAVRLRRNGDAKQGVTVSVHLPAGLLADSTRAERPARPAVAPAPAEAAAPATALAAPPTSVVGGTTKAGLPTRVRGASGATPSPVPGATKKLLPTRTPGAHGPTAADVIQTPAKPVIDGADAAGEEKAPTNGHAAEDSVLNGTSDTSQINGNSAQVDEPAPAEPAEAGAPTATVAEPAGAEPQASDASTAEVAEPEVTDAAAAKTDDAAEPQRSSAGLPVRKPRATGITEYREFEDAPSTAQDAATDKSGTKSDAPAAKGGRLSWLPGRKAAAEAARLEAESESAEPRQMPSNLSAWLEHRAKIVEASKARELGADGPAVDGEAAAQPETSESSPEVTDSTTAMHVPEEWVTEAADAEALPEASLDGHAGTVVAEPTEADEQVSAPVDSTEVIESPVARQGESTHLPTRVPGATSSPATEALADGAPAGRPAMRAHNTSIFGARRARGAAAAAQPEPVATAEAATPEPVVEEVAEPVAAVEETTEVVAIDEPVAEAVPDSADESTDESTDEVPEVAEDTTEVVASAEPEGVDETVDQPVDEPVDEHVEVANEGVDSTPDPVLNDDAHSIADADADAGTFAQADAEADADSFVPAEAHTEAHTEAHADTQSESVTEKAPAQRTADLNDTPIFRAMMSRWLTDDSSVPPSASWSTNEADQAWSAAARIEETQPLEESAAGLPMRRPGSFLIPGAVDESDEKPAAPAAPRRDPEAIRRNLNRHKNGVSSARTEAQDGTHREEADVHH
jgi:hypothetical protein